MGRVKPGDVSAFGDDPREKHGVLARRYFAVVRRRDAQGSGHLPAALRGTDPAAPCAVRSGIGTPWNLCHFGQHTA
jgi:hypothetical protein